MIKISQVSISSKGIQIVGFVLFFLCVIYFLLSLEDEIFCRLLHINSTNHTPLQGYHHWVRYHHDPLISTKLALIFFLLPFILTASGLHFYVNTKRSSLYGNARWATFTEANKTGLFASKGILLGKKWDRYLCMGGFEHVMVFAPSGSGKTRGISIPNLLTWSDSIICNDIKLELYKKTAAFRQKHGSHCFLWNPGALDGKTHCYNPLDLIKNNPRTRIDDAQKLASIFIPDNPRTDPIWYTLPRTLLVALILYILDTPEIPTTITAIMKLVKSQPCFSDFLIELLSIRSDLDPICRQNFHLFLQLPEKTQASILAAFIAHFELFDNPLIEAATSKSDFDITQLRRTKMTIYVGITNDNIVRLAPLISLFYQQVVDVMMRQEPEADEPLSVLFLMDEFAALNRMAVFEKNVGLFRSYHLRLLIIVQDLSQLRKEYGEEGAKIFINSKIKVAFAQSDLETAKWLSDLAGMTTIKIKNKSQQTDHMFKATESSHWSRRPLLLSQEILRLKPNKALILVEGYYPIICRKMYWDQDNNLKKRIGRCSK